MAAVFCACFRRSAMRLRSRRHAHPLFPRRRARGARRRRWRAAARPAREPAQVSQRPAAARSWPGAPPGISARRSLVSRPSLPVRGDRRRRPACSPRSACARPATAVPLRLPVRAPLPGPEPAQRLRRCRRRAQPRALRPARPSPSPRAIADHAEHGADLDVCAFGDADLRQRAGRGAYTSSVTLSVSSSTSASSAATLSPTLLHPFRDRRLGDGFAQGGNDDIAAHGGTSFLGFRRPVLPADNGPKL